MLVALESRLNATKELRYANFWSFIIQYDDLLVVMLRWQYFNSTRRTYVQNVFLLGEARYKYCTKVVTVSSLGYDATVLLFMSSN